MIEAYIAFLTNVVLYFAATAVFIIAIVFIGALFISFIDMLFN